MKIVFFGTPSFAVPTLKALSEKHEVVSVVTQPDRRKNRGHKLVFSPVKEEALALGLEVLQPERVKEARIPDADAYVVVAYGQIFGEELLKQPRYGCFNVHASLLPKYRGAAPMERAIEAGEAMTGVSIMKMERGLDTGDVLMIDSLSCAELTAEELKEKLAVMGAELMMSALDRVERGKAVYTPQKHEDSTYAKMIKKTDFQYREVLSFRENRQKIRAFGYVKVSIDDKMMKIFAIRKSDASSVGVIKGESCGDSGNEQIEDRLGDSRVPEGDVAVVLEDGIYLRSADGDVEVTELQPPSGKRMSAKAYLLGRKNKAAKR